MAPDGLPDKLMNRMQVVAEEVVMNIAMHAYGPDAQGPVLIEYAAGPDAARLIFTDAGKPFDPLAAPPEILAKTLDEARIGGRGLTLIRKFCTAVSYRYEDGRNELTAAFERI